MNHKRKQLNQQKNNDSDSDESSKKINKKQFKNMTQIVMKKNHRQNKARKNQFKF